jgi:hypothetical protein
VLEPILDEDGDEIIGRQMLRYDYLVIAVGSVTNAYKTPGAERYCIFLDDRDEADVVEYRDMLTIIRDRVDSLAKGGINTDLMVSSRLAPDYDGRYGSPATLIGALSRRGDR